MARKIVEGKIVTNAEAQEILGKIKEEELGEFQRRTLDYARKFSKISPDKAEKLVEDLSSKLQLDRADAIQIVNSLPKTIVEDLSSKLQLDRADAIQIVNSLPKTIEELRAVLTVKGRFVSTDQLNGILEIMKRYV